MGGDLTDDLAGLTLECACSTGNEYRLTFGVGELHFPHLNGDDPETVVPLPYSAGRRRSEQYLVGSVVKHAAIHVALVVDLVDGRVDVSGLMPGGWEFLDTATARRAWRAAI